MISTEKHLQKMAAREAEIKTLIAGNVQLEQDNLQLKSELDKQASRIEALTAQVKWFQNQIFGQKSERRIVASSESQLYLGESFALKTSEAEEKPQTIKERKRKRRNTTESKDGDNEELFFDEETVPVEEIRIPNPAVKGLEEGEYEVIEQRKSYRLAQHPGSYVVLKYVRDVIKLKVAANSEVDKGNVEGKFENKSQIICPTVHDSVFEKSHADVSFLVGLLIDKFLYHLPLYRQHQRLLASGIQVSRQWLTQLVHRCGNLLEPIFSALVDSIRQARVKIMDETPIKAGRKKKGKMREAYFWPVMVGSDIVFLYFNSREHYHVFEALGSKPGSGSVILSDGYEAYNTYAKATGTLNAQCWTHSRRCFIKAEEMEPVLVKEALDLIRPLWENEKELKTQGLVGKAKGIYRAEHSKPVVDAFFSWVQSKLIEKALLPSNPLTKALNYVNEREDALRLFLTDPDLPLDTNELERALRVIPMGRKNWLFCWTEVGAKYVGIFQSLIVTCKMHGIDPHVYLTDVLQRVAFHPRSQIFQLTPGQWKIHFADNPLRSDLHNISKRQ